ncbi:MAG: cytochrome ubiquinol oxidase subunit I [Chloroherpetonaceae bacterium]|nr:cytochrome ubiquinol oxidase subunit I [Chloroherpetonaceae bacterium]
MNYPFWDVPIIGSGWVIGIIAIYHTLISQFAVGGGLYLVLVERKALKEGRADWLPKLRQHARFFLILTGVFGAVSGVGIWFAIGLANPESTSTLIHNFVFGWAIEWVFFIVELTAAAVYYYSWGKIDNELHLKVGWVYAGASFLTLVIINGILSFMLTPGDAWMLAAGTGYEASRFWHAFFNPTYFPSLLMRILVCVSLAGVWALYSHSRLDGHDEKKVKSELIVWSSKWLIPTFVLMPFALIWYLWSVPEVQRGLLELGISTAGSGAFTQVTRISLVMIMTTATITGIVYFFSRFSPHSFSYGHGIAVLVLALIATASAEYSREMLRKPYSIAGHMYSNGIRKSEVSTINREGYLPKTKWIRTVVDKRDSVSQILSDGEAMYRGQCQSCHTSEGYRSMTKFLKGREHSSIKMLLTTLHEYQEDSPYRKYMPQLAGKVQEIEALADYLDYKVNKEQSKIAMMLRAREKREEVASGNQ